MRESDPLLIQTRAALLDALDALDEHVDSLVVIGAQAVYLHTGDTKLALAPLTKDADLGVDLRSLKDHPQIEEAMREAGFYREPGSQPGAWLSRSGMPVDLMVPEALAGKAGRRSVTAPPHDKRALRRANGLEACMVDNVSMEITSLDGADPRARFVRVAGISALIVAKAHKVGERLRDNPGRAQAKDAHDLYRLLVSAKTLALAATLAELRSDEMAGQATRAALAYLTEWFADAGSAGALLAGEAEDGVGDPVQVANATSILVQDLLGALGS